MEETDVCYLTPPVRSLQQAIPHGCAAKFLPPSQRLQIALQAVAGTVSVTDLASDFEVSRKFVYQQKARATAALTEAFAPQAADDTVLFYLPVTKRWLCQFVLALVLIGHSPLRGVVEILRDVFDYTMSLGTVFNIVHSAVAAARERNQAQDLRLVQVGGHDEIFQTDRPVLVGVDLHSTYCYLLSVEEHRDADTWGVHLLELQARGLDPDCFVADAGKGLRAAHAEVFGEKPCRSDIFHVQSEVGEVATKLENRAYEVMNTCADLARKIARAKQQGRRADASWVNRGKAARKKQDQAIALADAVALLSRWLRADILALAGPPHAERLALYDFVCAELEARVPQARHLLGPLVTYLRGQRDQVLAFAAQLDRDFAELAAAFAVPAQLVRNFFALHTLDLESPLRWRRDAEFRRLLGGRCYLLLSKAVDDLCQRTVRASSLVENLNSRLRSYFFLRRHLGNAYLTLLQFFLNHRRYPRSDRPERANRSPAELLTGQEHPHWLELLGYSRFSRS
jgi:hypothetical protein